MSAEKILSLPEKMAQFDGPLCCDTANAERFLHLFGDEVRYCPPEKAWYWWDGRRWKIDEMNHVQELALQTAAAIRDEASIIDDEKQKKALWSWAIKSNQSGKLKAMLECSSMRDSCKIAPHNLDANPWLLNLENGTLDLRTQQLAAHHKEDYLSCIAPCAFDVDASAMQFAEFIYKAMGNDASLMDWLQRLLGYCLSGVTNKQCFGLFQGKSGTGKSTLLNIVHRIMGPDYSGTISSRSLFKPNDRESQVDLNHVARCRLVTTSESIEGKAFPESFLKAITGGESISMRQMFERTREFNPAYKIILGTNFKPSVRESGDAIWRRMVFVPFEKKIAVPDLNFAERICNEERSGILNWLLAGARLALEMDGFTKRPAVIEEAMQEYRSEEDIVGAFIEDYCDEGDDIEIPFKELYAAFRKHREEMGDGKYVMSSKAFALRLDARGIFKGVSGHHNDKVRKGVRLKGRII